MEDYGCDVFSVNYCLSSAQIWQHLIVAIVKHGNIMNSNCSSMLVPFSKFIPIYWNHKDFYVFMS